MPRLTREAHLDLGEQAPPAERGGVEVARVPRAVRADGFGVRDEVVRLADDGKERRVEVALAPRALAAEIRARRVRAARHGSRHEVRGARADVSVALALVPQREDDATLEGRFAHLLHAAVPVPEAVGHEVRDAGRFRDDDAIEPPRRRRDRRRGRVVQVHARRADALGQRVAAYRRGGHPLAERRDALRGSRVLGAAPRTINDEASSRRRRAVAPSGAVPLRALRARRGGVAAARYGGVRVGDEERGHREGQEGRGGRRGAARRGVATRESRSVPSGGGEGKGRGGRRAGDGSPGASIEGEAVFPTRRRTTRQTSIPEVARRRARGRRLRVCARG